LECNSLTLDGEAYQATFEELCKSKFKVKEYLGWEGLIWLSLYLSFLGLLYNTSSQKDSISRERDIHIFGRVHLYEFPD
jgi:hypothetical protein